MYWEKGAEDWMGASVWRLGRTAEDRLMYGRSVKTATSGNGLAKEKEGRKEHIYLTKRQ